VHDDVHEPDRLDMQVQSQAIRVMSSQELEQANESAQTASDAASNASEVASDASSDTKAEQTTDKSKK
jgi:hypothetical protein